jgi:hypothetical protein
MLGSPELGLLGVSSGINTSPGRASEGNGRIPSLARPASK